MTGVDLAAAAETVGPSLRPSGSSPRQVNQQHPNPQTSPRAPLQQLAGSGAAPCGRSSFLAGEYRRCVGSGRFSHDASPDAADVAMTTST